MNITVLKEYGHPSYITGGGCAISNLTVIIDPSLPILVQREVVIHEVIEGYFSCLPHNKVDEITEILNKALEEIGG